MDQEDAREVEEEEGEGPGAEPQEVTSHRAEKQVGHGVRTVIALMWLGVYRYDDMKQRP